jgi:hypothetical protein
VVGTGNRRTVVTYLVQNHQVSITRACKTTGFSKSQYYYQSKKDDSEVVDYNTPQLLDQKFSDAKSKFMDIKI